MGHAKPVILTTGCDIAPEALERLTNFKLIYAGRQPAEDDLCRLCERYHPVAFIVRYGKHKSFIKMGTAAASNLLKVLAKPLKKEGALL
ncbi:MAG TPA: hypothetical protein DCM44_00230 [Pantoea sp.]|uniref:hypothetical protein n=1 Tax=Pantoea TaxID=53335 RepID=UPI000BB54218|nr:MULTISPECIES: hypothetical protein [Pantoea]PNK63385.1 hypothetical protein A6J33_011705 [Pantoea sp. FDAARGOS_194]HAK33422.1 hypothetical protein [Pantoea sp.]